MGVAKYSASIFSGIVQNSVEIVNCLVKNKINQLYIIGGDGSFHAALSIQKEIWRRDLKIALVTIPKTIDNDISRVAKLPVEVFVRVSMCKCYSLYRDESISHL